MNYKLYVAGLALALGLVCGCNDKSSELEQCLDQKTTLQFQAARDNYLKEMENSRLNIEKSYKENLKLGEQIETEYKAIQENMELLDQIETGRQKLQEMDCQRRLDEQVTKFRRMVIGSGSNPIYYGGGSL